jgi:hypothetical protein
VTSPGARMTARLRLVPIGPAHVEDVVRLHRDQVLATWYAGALATQEEAEAFARSCDLAWRVDGLHKWMAYDRQTGDL